MQQESIGLLTFLNVDLYVTNFDDPFLWQVYIANVIGIMCQKTSAKEKKTLHKVIIVCAKQTRGRCYNHNFPPFCQF
jgi:hypothetical protein